MVQILGSEKFPQTRLIPWVFSDCQQRQALHCPTIFLPPRILFFHSHRELRLPSPQGSQYTSLTMCTNLLLSWIKHRLPFAADSSQNCLCFLQCHSQSRGAWPFPPLLLAPVRLLSSDSHSLANYQLLIMQVLSETNVWITVRTDLAHNWNALFPFFLKPGLWTSFSVLFTLELLKVGFCVVKSGRS